MSALHQAPALDRVRSQQTLRAPRQLLSESRHRRQVVGHHGQTATADAALPQATAHLVLRAVQYGATLLRAKAR